MLQCPVTYFEKNLIFDNRKGCWGVFKLHGFNYDNLDEGSQLDIWKRTARFLAGIVDEAKILMIPVIQDVESYSKNLLRRLNPNDVLYEHTANHITMTRDYLLRMAETTGNANDYDFYIIVKLVATAEQDIPAKVKTAIDQIIKEPVNTVHRAFLVDRKDILASDFRHFEVLAARFLQEQNKRLAISPTTSGETQMLLKRVTQRGNEKNIRVNLTRRKVRQEDGSYREELSEWTPFAQHLPLGKRETIVRPAYRDTVNLFSGIIDTKTPRQISVMHDNGKTIHQTFLVVTHIPDVQEFPGSEWLYLFQQLNCQCEVCIHIKNIEFRQALGRLEKKKRELTSQYDNVAEARAAMPEEVETGYREAGELESEIKETRNPLCETYISVAVYDTDLENLERKAEHIKQVYEDQGFRIERPATDQFKLFLQHIPGAGMYARDFKMELTPTTLAGGIIGAKAELGDNKGMFIGTTGRLNKPVYLDMGQACIMNMSAAAVLFGDLGFGKSFNANLLVYLNILCGGYGLVFDPKGERTHWKEELPIPEELITIVTLDSSDENAGKLDPFLIYKEDFAEASALAVNVLAEMFQLKPKEPAYTVLSECVGKLAGHPNPCMQSLVEMIESIGEEDSFYTEADRLARSIKVMKNAGLSKLLFGTGKEEAISLDNRLNILQIQNLKMPGPETAKEDYTLDENLSSVLMMIIGHFAKKFALVKRPVFSQILFDESWMLGKTAEGVKLYDFLSRMGRSLFTGCIFNGHSVLDIPTEGIKNTITYSFFFHSDNTGECKRMLDFLGMDCTEGNIELIKGLQNRECLFRDAYGRIGKLTFDCVFEDLLHVFSTTPTTEQEESA